MMVSCKHLLLLLTVLISKCISTSSSSYSKYPHYPKYCSRPSEMHKRSIPALNSSLYPNTQLLQVNTIIRHGARTPWSNRKCWDDAKVKETNNKDNDNDKSTSFSWDCTLQTVLGPPINKVNLYSKRPQLLFDKNYDAFDRIQEEEKEVEKKAAHGNNNEQEQPQTFLLSNFLNGTCELGQLLEDGYEQQIQNGKILRLGYMSPRTKPSLNLFINLRLNETYSEPYIYYRSDDMPRTLMSGQVLLQSLFGTSISTNDKNIRLKVHTGDFVNDVLIPNPNICPKLNDIIIDAKNSNEYQQYIKNIDDDVTKNSGMKKWKQINGDEKNIMDCIMTTICTDRSLPDTINDFDGIEDINNTNNTFTQLMVHDTWQWSYPYIFNNAQYSKLAMGPLWAEITDNILLTKSRTSIHQIADTVPRLTLFSGHDDTIMPLLATLGTYFQNNMIWTPYASMLLIEIHGVLQNTKNDGMIRKHVFRLIYNGRVITKHVDGCQNDDQLCDLYILLNLVRSFATRDRDCYSHDTIIPFYKQKSSSQKASSSHPPTIFAFFILSFICVVLGSLFTYMYMTYIVVDMKVQYGSANLNESSSNNNDVIGSSYRDDPNRSSGGSTDILDNRRPEVHFI